MRDQARPPLRQPILCQLLRILRPVLRRRPERAHVPLLILQCDEVILASLLRVSRAPLVLHDLLLSILLLVSGLLANRSRRLLRLF